LLLGLFGAISFVEATLTDLHPGGNINYFYEALFALVPAAALGIVRLLASSRRSVTVGFLVAALFLMFAKPKLAEVAVAASEGGLGFARVKTQNRDLERMRNALQGRRIFSTIPSIALIDPEPALLDPFSLWKIDARPLYERVRRAEFDVVITYVDPEVYRKVAWIPPGLRDAISAAYRPFCTTQGLLLETPSSRAIDSTFFEKLKQIGCTAVGRQQSPN
jgi:hypothetical protein